MTSPVADRPALSELVHRYAAYVDDRQFDSVAVLFTVNAELLLPDPPAVLDPVRSHRGRDAIGTAVAAVARVTRTEHAIVGEVYDSSAGRGPQDERARGRITCVAHHWSWRGDDPVDAVWHLRYDDEYARTEGGWRISRRALTINAIETRPLRSLRPRE